LIPRETAGCYSASIRFIRAELDGDKITVPELVTSWHFAMSLDTCIK